MATIMALLSTGKGTWAHAIRLIENKEFDKAVVLTNSFGRERYDAPEKASVAEVDFRLPVRELKEAIKSAIRPLIADEMEITLNLASGTGHEHMAVIAALFESGIGFRLVVLSGEGLQYL